MSRQLGRVLCRCMPLVNNAVFAEQPLWSSAASPAVLQKALQQYNSTWQYMQRHAFSSSTAQSE